MKNKEKFAKEILDIVCNGDEVAMGEDTRRLRACNKIDKFGCLNCYSYEENFPLHTKNCMANFVHWANSEYKEKKVFSEADKTFVRAADKLNWFARDYDGEIWGFVDRPSKSNVYWYVAGVNNANIGVLTTATFEPLSWEDDEPTSREEILEE